MRTDWDAYYENAFWASKYSRAHSSRMLLSILRAVSAKNCAPSIIELGGGNSCFFETLRQELQPSSYTIVDNNKKSLAMFENKYGQFSEARALEGNVLEMSSLQADIVFSVGLIEHFSFDDVIRVVETHFRMCNPGGVVLITFPTPTWLYRLIRGGAEMFNMWGFPDETPLPIPFVQSIMERFGEIKVTRTLWGTGLTQGAIAATVDA